MDVYCKCILLLILWIILEIGTAFAARDRHAQVPASGLSCKLRCCGLAYLPPQIINTINVKTFESETKENLGDPNGEEGCQKSK